MKKYRLKINSFIHSTTILFLGTIVFFSCGSPEEFPTTPEISFNNIKFVNDNSLILTFDFKDGDGDLGLEGNENFFPYHGFDPIIDAQGKFVTIGADDVVPPLYRLVNEGDSIKAYGFSETDNRPGFSCVDYDTLNVSKDRGLLLLSGINLAKDDTTFVLDTIYIVKNIRRNNIYIEFFRRIGDGENDYEVIDWASIFNEFGCGNDFNARFPIFDKGSLGSSLEGSISYSIFSTGFNSVIRTSEIKLKFYILDRAGHQSNVVETGDFTLEQITQ